MALKNAYSKINISDLFGNLQKTLVKHGARQITFDYGADGKVYGVYFTIPLQARMLNVKLPARIDKVRKVLREQGFRYDDEQIYRVAWRNVHDWVVAQMTLLETEAVVLEEIFLPYIVNQKGQTYFEVMENRQFELPSGEE